MSKIFTSNTRIVALIALVLALFLIFSAIYINQKVANANKRIIENELVLSLANLSAKIDARVGQMKLISKSLANDEHIHAWVEGGFDSNQEAVLVDKLGFFVQEYTLTSASFADKKTNKYWNHEGFLRELTPEIDTWYFAYLASGNQDLVSVYHDQNNKRVDLYVNYQQINGNGLSGIATSFNGVLDMLNNSAFAKFGSVYLVDRSGKIQVQSGNTKESFDDEKKAQVKLSKQTLQALFNERIATAILSVESEQSTQFTQAGTDVHVKDTLIGSSYIPSMDWFIVAHVPKEAFFMSATASFPVRN
jgi:hypothetical protein